MTTVEYSRGVLEADPDAPVDAPPGQARGLLAFVTTTDHKRIGIAYLVTAFVFFIIGGGLALLLRAELAEPGTQIIGPDAYNETFTMHGSIMLFLFLTPFAAGLGNYFVPLQIGAEDMAFPRLNALSYWFFLFGGLTMMAGFLTSDGPADFGWTAYTPLSDIIRSPKLGADLWLLALLLTGLSSILTAVNVIATALCMRPAGMTMFRMPIFSWNMVVQSVLVLIAFPVLTAASVMLLADRHLGAHVFDASAGGVPVLWQHLFWFFGHPEVYIVVLPFFGIVTEVLPVFSWRPIFGYAGIVFATIAIGALSVGVWAHHMFTTGAVLLPFFTGFSMLIAVPTGVKFFNWIGTLWGGRITFQTAMLFACGFLFTFLIGGLTGVLLAAAPIDLQVHDTYFVVAHFHYTLFGGSVFAVFAAVYYWFPKITGRLLHEGLGKWHFWLTLVGFHLTFFVQHILGLQGMPRRVADYFPDDGFAGLNQISTLGAFLTGVSMVPFLWNLWRTWRRGEPAGDDPWGGHTLEWATTSPPPPHNFVGELPPIRSNRPVWDLRHGGDAGAPAESGK